MTTITVKTFRCDGPDCEARTPTGTLPDGWTRVDSCDHLDATRAEIAGRRNGKRSALAARVEMMSGGIYLHLCPDHQDAFAEHAPRTMSHPGGRGRDTTVTVWCSCGWRINAVSNSYRVGTIKCQETRPSHVPEGRWWSHLPVELQSYSRKPTQETT